MPMLRPIDLVKGTGKPGRAGVDSEHAHQVALFAWVAVAKLHGFLIADRWAVDTGYDLPKWGGVVVVPELQWYHAIPNGGSRGDGKVAQIRGQQMTAEGVRSGVADTFLPVPKIGPTGVWCHGLYIEMKRPGLEKHKNGGCSDKQIEFGRWVVKRGYGWIVCYGWKHAADTIKAYLGSTSA